MEKDKKDPTKKDKVATLREELLTALNPEDPDYWKRKKQIEENRLRTLSGSPNTLNKSRSDRYRAVSYSSVNGAVSTKKSLHNVEIKVMTDVE